GDLPAGGLHRMYPLGAQERVDPGVQVDVHAQLAPRLLDGGHDVGVGDLGHGPRVRVDQMRLDAAVGQRGGHLHADGLRLGDDRALHRVEDPVPALGRADVPDVVQPVEFGTGDLRPLVLEAG